MKRVSDLLHMGSHHRQKVAGMMMSTARPLEKTTAQRQKNPLTAVVVTSFARMSSHEQMRHLTDEHGRTVEPTDDLPVLHRAAHRDPVEHVHFSAFPPSA